MGAGVFDQLSECGDFLWAASIVTGQSAPCGIIVLAFCSVFVLVYALNMETIAGESRGQTAQKIRNGLGVVAACPGREFEGA